MSTILSADDLNDFIAPGVACIKPVEVQKNQDSAAIEIGPDGVPVERREDGSADALKPAQISLTDCLACSGCVTSSEEFLLELQSPKELLKALEDPNKVRVASICHQTRVSLAHAYGITVEEVDMKLKHVLVDKLGFHYVVSTEVGRAVALVATVQEALQRLDGTQKRTGPTLSSVCPGWTIYAEKTHPHILPFLSSIRSPQQITGRLVKTLISNDTGKSPENIYHMSIMPCFDKKLEASRADFDMPDGAKEVDIVLTAKELVQLTQDNLDTDFLGLQSSDITQGLAPAHWPRQGQWLSNVGSSSGGYLDYVVSAAQRTLPPSTLVTIPGKNSDTVEYQLVDNISGATLFRGAQIYGFRNIQNLVRKLKPGRPTVRRAAPANGAKSRATANPLEYDYVEIMACPGGCINGGGQIGPPSSLASKVWISELDEIYNSLGKYDVSSDKVRRNFTDMGITPDDKLLRATYKPLEQDTSLPAALAVGTQW